MTTITNNILNYICIFLNLQLLIKLYKQFLHYSNIIYSIEKIKKPKYKELDIFVSSIKSLSTILKTMICVNNINKKIALMEYLRTNIFDNLKNQAK